MDEWITLVETRYSKAQYRFVAKMAYPHYLRNTDSDRRIALASPSTVLLSTAELAAIPPVKALVEAAQQLRAILQATGIQVLSCDLPTDLAFDRAARKIDAALAAFEEKKEED